MISQFIGIVVNGKPRDVAMKTTLPALLADLGVDRRAIAVALNEDVVPRVQHESVILNEGDRVEIVRMVGGG